MQLGPDARAGTEGHEPDTLAAEAKRQHKKTRAPVLAGLRVTDHRAGAIIDFRFFPGRGLDDRVCFQRWSSAQLADETLDAFVGTGEAMLVHQLLPDGHGISAM